MCTETKQDLLLAQYHLLRDRRDEINERAHYDLLINREVDSLNDRLDDLAADLHGLQKPSTLSEPIS